MNGVSFIGPEVPVRESWAHKRRRKRCCDGDITSSSTMFSTSSPSNWSPRVTSFMSVDTFSCLSVCETTNQLQSSPPPPQSLPTRSLPSCSPSFPMSLSPSYLQLDMKCSSSCPSTHHCRLSGWIEFPSGSVSATSLPSPCPSSSSSSSSRSTSLSLGRTSPSPSWSWLIVTLLFMCTISFSCSEPCVFPTEWTGSWFQKGIPDPIRVSASEISEKGICKEISGDKFLIENRQERCVRCMVINQKHNNVLQYKETYCYQKSRHSPRSLREVCAEINGDASLYSLFRLDTHPVACPFSGPFRFSYSRGHGECRDPLSTIDSCTDESRLLFRFQACADVQGSESRVEELSCWAEWKEGSIRYLVGRMEHRTAKTDEDKFRCFVFERNRNGTGFSVAQSGDATCDGLSSAYEGSRIMRLQSGPSSPGSGPFPAGCVFPTWVTSSRHWRTFDDSQIYDFSPNSSFIVYGNNSTKLRVATCVRIERDLPRAAQVVVHSVSGCKIGFMCIKMYGRNNDIVELEGSQHMTHSAADACAPHNFAPGHGHHHSGNHGSSSLSPPSAMAFGSTNHHHPIPPSNYLTITTFNLKLEECPVDGSYSVVTGSLESGSSPMSGPDESLSPSLSQFVCSDQSFLHSRCKSPTVMQLLSRCSDSSDFIRNFYCHGSWKEDETTFTVVTSPEHTKQYCITSQQDGAEGDVRVRFLIHSGSCPNPKSITSPITPMGVMSPPSIPISSNPAFMGNNGNQVRREALLTLVDHGMCQSPTTSGSSHITPFTSSFSISISWFLPNLFLLNPSLILPLLSSLLLLVMLHV